MGRTRFEQVLRLPKPVRVSGSTRGLAGQRVDDGSAPVGVPSRCRVRHVLSGSRCATRLAPSRWTGFLIAMTKTSTVPVSIDFPRHHRRPGLPREYCDASLTWVAGVRPPPSWTPLGWPPMSPPPQSRTPPLSTPWSASWPGPGGGSVCRWPTAPGCAGSWATATTGTRGGGWSRGRTVPTTRHATWTSAASVPAADRSRTAGPRGNPDRVNTAAPAGRRRVGDGYAGCTTDRRRYLDEAVLYSDEEFLGVVVPFLQEGAAVGEPCPVALGASTTGLVRAAMGNTSGITFLDDRYDRPRV